MRSLAELYAMYKGPVYGYLYRMCGQGAEAEELTQETFYQAVLSLHRLEDRTDRAGAGPPGPAAIPHAVPGKRGGRPVSDCPLIRDLLPLYVDDAVSPSSRERIQQHLEDCAGRRDWLRQLRSPLPPLPPPPDGAPTDARFLLRLKRNAGTALGMVLVLLVVTALGAHQYGRQARDAEYGRMQAAQRQQELAAVATLGELTPDPQGILAARGITVSVEAGRNGSGATVAYRAVAGPDARVDQLIPVRLSAGGLSARILDPVTGRELDWGRTGGRGGWLAGEGGGGVFDYATPPQGPVQALFEFPVLAAALPAGEMPVWEFRRPGAEGEVPLGQRLTVRGVEFEVERVSFAGDQVRVTYRQLTDPLAVGVHLLSMRLSDGLGGGWNPLLPEYLPDPRQPHQEFHPINSPSQQWSLTVQYAVLIVPGPRLPIELD